MSMNIITIAADAGRVGGKKLTGFAQTAQEQARLVATFVIIQE